MSYHYRFYSFIYRLLTSKLFQRILQVTLFQHISENVYKNKGPRILKEIVKQVSVAYHRRRQNTSQCILVLESIRKIQCSLELDRMLYSQRDQQDHLQQWVLIPIWPGIPPSSWLKAIGLHTCLLCCRMKDPVQVQQWGWSSAI